jgi:glycosyltransferase involved in cell wall biosynthesis
VIIKTIIQGMKKVLLISNYVYHYRINNYNYFYERFKQEGIEFQVLANEAQHVDFDVHVPIYTKKPGRLSYIKYILEQKPDCVILFLHLKDFIIFPVTLFCRIKKIPVVYWNFGIDLLDPDSKIKNWLYRRLHWLSNAILLYSPNEMVFIKSRFHYKTFVANNTINLTDLENISFSGNYIKENFNVKEKFIVLFVGRIIVEKKVDELLQCFRNSKDIAVVIAGKGITEEMIEIINRQSNYYYLGEIKYDKTEIARIYHSADIICIPGNVGLAIIESFFWGKPLVTIKPPDRYNSPEICYLKDGENGFIAQDIADMENKIADLLANPEQYRKFSEKAKETAMHEAHISKMYEGFKKVVDFLIKP